MEKDPIPQATSPLATWLSYLEHLHSKTIDLGLARVSEVAGQMDIVKPAPFVFTVAGTNGKGTTCRTLETILMAAGYKVGVYSSPHLVRYTERVRIQGAELPEAAHTASFAEIEAARGDISLTYFEYGTLSALWLFKQAQLDVVILEVGLGGRLDATNIVDADVAVVTSIALDHTDWLGPDRESIGREKAGIFRAGKPAVVGEPDMPLTIAEVASEKGALLQRRGVDWRYEAGRLKTLAKTGRVLAVIGMLHDKDIAGTLANLAPEVDAWYCAPLEGPRGATAEQLVEHLRCGTVYSSVAQAWRAAMADAKVEDTVLVCGSFHTVAQVMEEIDAGRIGGE